MIASEAEANINIGFSNRSNTFMNNINLISSVDSLENESDNASTEPSTSPLSITFNSLN
jgi:hypothetical protein